MFMAFLLTTALLSAQVVFADDVADTSQSVGDSTVNVADVALDANPVSAPESVDAASLNQDNVLQAVGIDVVGENISLQDNQIHESDYGGSYIDADGNVNVMLVDNSASLQNIKKDKSRDLSKKVIKSNEKDNKDVKVKAV